MNPNVEAVLNRLDALAAKLGVASTELWRILMKQAEVQGHISTTLAWIFGSLGMLVFLFPFVMYAQIKPRSSKYDDPGMVFFLLLLCIPLMIAAVCNGITAYTIMHNPEYWALQQVMKALK